MTVSFGNFFFFFFKFFFFFFFFYFFFFFFCILLIFFCSGKTDHFTNFAILLGADIGDGCDDGEKVDEVIAWLSLAVIILIIIAVVIIELHTRRRIAKMNKDIKSGKRRPPQRASSRSVRSALLNNN